MSEALLFVHGTGVRQKGRAQTVGRILEGFADVGLGSVRVDYVDWGSELGTTVGEEDIAAVLPLGSTMSLSGVSTAEVDAAEWAELLADPLSELRMASIREAPATPAVPIPGTGIKQADDDLDERLAGLVAKLPPRLPGGVTQAAIVAAATELRRERVLRDAALSAGRGNDPDLIRATARSLAASALRDAQPEPGVGPEALFRADLREALVEEIRRALAPTTMGVGGWLKDKVKGFALAKATRFVHDRRAGLLRSADAAVGDVLLYQRRGDDILDAIEAKILALAKDHRTIVVLGHSLGGIMLVDLLSRPRAAGPLPVAKLVTVGSQAPALYKFDALGTLRPGGAALPFTPWLNVFDRNDFLAFCASRAFPTPRGIQDVEIASGVPFPEAHSAYFYQPKLYQQLAAFCSGRHG